VITSVNCSDQEPLKVRAKELGVPVMTDRHAYATLAESSPDSVFSHVDLVISYLHASRIREPLIRLPRLGCFNFHPAPLPELRGLGGYNFAILNGMRQYGVSVHWVAESIDTGDIVEVDRWAIDPDCETAVSLERESQERLAALFVRFMEQLEAGHAITALRQGDGSYITRQQMEAAKALPSAASAEQIDRCARAFWFPPFDGAYVERDGVKFTIVPPRVLKELAVPGGLFDVGSEPAALPERAAAKRVLLSLPHMGGNEEDYVRQAFATNWLSTVGPNITAFEKEIGKRIGLPAVALSSGTAAIHLGLRLLGVTAKDEVFCPTLTFAASCNPVRYLGAEPVFLDSDYATWNLDPNILEDALRERARRNKLPRAVIVVHLYGQCADMEPILALCRRYDVSVLEDAAEALGATYHDRPAGTYGHIGVFSFNGNKIITTTGGGMLVSANEAWVDKARFWSQQARDPGLAYEHSELGYNYRMSNVLAGIGRGQLEVLDLRVQQRRAIAFRYRGAFADLPGISLMPQAAYGLHTNWLSCFLIEEEKFGRSRDQLIRALDEAGVESRPVWKPMHLQPLYAGCEHCGGDVAEDLFRRGICLPSSSSLTAEDQLHVVNAVRAAAGMKELDDLKDRVTV
jgi:pyridoxal phosphate-dependent aminotransferase EpsN